MKKKKDPLRYLKKGGWLSFLGLAALVVAVLAHSLVTSFGGLALRRDITPGQVYTLSDASLSALSGLEADVELLAVSDGAAEAGLFELLSRYEAASPHIRVRTVSTGESVYWAGAQQSEGSVIVVGSQYEQALDASSFTEQVYENRAVVDVLYCAERRITNSIAYVTADLPVACVTFDHGETALEAGFLNVLAEAGYHVRNIYLTENGQIPSDCALIVCNVPQIDLTQQETQAILSFLREGGRFALATNSQLLPEQTNLQRVAAAAGMAAVQGVVMELDEQHVYSPDYPYYLLPETADGEITAEVAQLGIPVLMSQAHAIEAVTPRSLMTPLLTTTEASYIKPSVYQDGVIAYAEGDRTGPFCVAAVGETISGGKVFWMPSAVCLSDSVDSMVLGANYALASAAISWMQGGAPLEPIEIASPSVMEASVSTAGQPVLTAMLIALPAAALLVGIIASARHRKGRGA